MDTIQLNISKQQFFGILQAMPEQDQLEIFDRLRKSLFVSRFDRLLRSEIAVRKPVRPAATLCPHR